MEKMTHYIEINNEDYKILWNAYDSDDAHNDETKVEILENEDWKIIVSDWENFLKVETWNFRPWIYEHYKWNEYQVFGTINVLWKTYVVYKGLYQHHEKRFEDNFWYREIKNFSPEKYKYTWKLS